MRTYSGNLVRNGKGSPTLEDIAVMQGRLCRYNGACEIYWPVLVHSLAVADLLVTPEQKINGLLHDAAEVIISDIPRGIKTKKWETLELKYLKNIYQELRVVCPTSYTRDKVIIADNEIGRAECKLFGPKNIVNDYEGTITASSEALRIVDSYASLKWEDVLDPEGKYVRQFITMFESLHRSMSPVRASKQAMFPPTALDRVRYMLGR